MPNKNFTLLLAICLLAGQFSYAKALNHSVGTNIIKDGTVYTVTEEDGLLVRRPYTSAGAFLSYGFNSWSNVVEASTEDINNLLIGTKIPPQDGKIICADRGFEKGTCYLMTNGQKAGFTSAEVFQNLGFTFNHTMSGDVSFLTTTDNIDNSTNAHRPGTIVNKDNVLYVVRNNGLVKISDWNTLHSWGYTEKDVVLANNADRNLQQVLTLYSREPQNLSILQYLKPASETIKITNPEIRVGKLVQTKNGAIYLVGNNGLIGFDTFANFQAWGFCITDPVSANNSESNLPILGNMPAKGINPLPWYIPSNLPINLNCPNGQTIEILSPSGGENFAKGELVQIIWNSVGANSINIELYKVGYFYRTLASNISGNNTSFYWNTPTDIPDGTDYSIKISDPNRSSFSAITRTFSFSTIILNQSAKARDEQRISTIRLLSSALERYFNDNNNSYPNTLNNFPSNYNAPTPIAPEPADGICTNQQNTFNYQLLTQYTFKLSFCLGEQTGAYSKGFHTLTESGIK